MLFAPDLSALGLPQSAAQAYAEWVHAQREVLAALVP